MGVGAQVEQERVWQKCGIRPQPRSPICMVLVALVYPLVSEQSGFTVHAAGIQKGKGCPWCTRGEGGRQRDRAWGGVVARTGPVHERGGPFLICF